MLKPTGHLTALYRETTFKRIVEDALFFRQQAEGETENKQKGCYARVVILLMAFYLESLSNLVFEELVKKKLKDYDSQAGLSKPVQRFRAIHCELLGGKPTLKDEDINGIQDIFTIRNKIIAHPAGRAKLHIDTDEDRRSRVDRQVTYKKFKNFPLVYSHFTLKEADIILKEVKEFLTKFLNLVKERLSEQQFNDWWPKELVEWSNQ